MGFIAVLVNCALIGLSGQVHRLLPDMTAIQTVLLIVALEVCLNFKLLYTINVHRGRAFLTNSPSPLQPQHIAPNDMCPVDSSTWDTDTPSRVIYHLLFKCTLFSSLETTKIHSLPGNTPAASDMKSRR